MIKIYHVYFYKFGDKGGEKYEESESVWKNCKFRSGSSYYTAGMYVWCGWWAVYRCTGFK
jgi:hypothetical protein